MAASRGRFREQNGGAFLCWCRLASHEEQSRAPSTKIAPPAWETRPTQLLKQGSLALTEVLPNILRPANGLAGLPPGGAVSF
jgi:hypothetical protein